MGWLQRGTRWSMAVAAALAVAGSPAQVASTGPPRLSGPGEVRAGMTLAAMPFGMVAPGPEWEQRRSGDGPRATRLLGLSSLRSGGLDAAGELLLLPAAGRRWDTGTTDFSARIEPGSEWAKPGYYRATLEDLGARVELTASPRVAWQRYTFASGERAQLLIDLQHGPTRGASGPVAALERVERSEVSVDADRGEVAGTVWLAAPVARQYSFVLRLDRPIEQLKTLPQREGEKAPRLLAEVHLGATRMVVVRIGFSTVDVAGARRNLDELPRRPFFEQRALAERAWADMLGRVRLDADEPTRRAFYAALHRVLLQPADIADADGRVRGPRGEVFAARGGRYHSAGPLTQQFRAAHPLLTLLVPERVDALVGSLLDHQRQQGYLPLHTLWGRESWRALGNPALPVLSDALAKGFAADRQAEILEAMVQTATASRPDAPPWAQRDWSLLDQTGYLPFDREADGSVVKTLEIGTGDDAVARVARQLGRDDIARASLARAGSYWALFDPQLRLMRGRDTAGSWREPFDPWSLGSATQRSDYSGSNAWLATTLPALHDPAGFRAMLGGPDRLASWLNQLLLVQMEDAAVSLGQRALINQLPAGDLFGHHVPWLYAYSDEPWRGQALVRRIARQLSQAPRGGSRSIRPYALDAWLVFATLGLYPLVPGGGEYVLGAPLVRAARLQLPGGKPLLVLADGLDEQRRYAQRVLLNGREWGAVSIPHRELMRGGELRFGMSSLP